MTKYMVPEQNVIALEKRLAALSKRTVKAGNVAVTSKRTGEFIDETTPKGLVRMIEIEVTGDAPAYNGWNFMATLCRTDEGNIVRAVPGYTVSADYRDGEHTCDHCNTVRQRRDTYVLRHDDGRTVRVGSSCLQDFLQHSASGISLAARLVMEAHSMAESATQSGWLGGNTMGPIYRFDLHTFLTYVAQVVLDSRGQTFITRSKAREAGTNSTADQAYSAMQGSFTVVRTPEAEELASKARDYVLVTYEGNIFKDIDDDDDDDIDLKARWMAATGVQKTLSDFEHNLLTAARAEAIEARLIGIAAYIIEAYRRAQPKPAAASLNTEGLGRIFGMFNAASGKLKRPTIRLMGDDGQHISLNLAGAASTNKGHIYVKGPANSDVYYGKVSPDGRFLPVRSCPDTVRTQLQAFADDPETVASKYGKVTGCCSFCGRNLSDERSTEVGYGKVCAERFGLRWGNSPAAVAVEVPAEEAAVAA